MAATHFKSKGEMIAIDPRALNDFYKDLKSAFGHYVAGASIIGMWSDYNGDGLFTSAGVSAGKALIKNVIDGTINIGTNWAPLSDEHLDSYPGLSVYGTHWKYRGNVYQNIVAQKRGRGYAIGVDKRRMVTPTGFSTHAGTAKLAEKIPVARYAAWVEYGTKWMPPRPLFGPATLYYAQKFGPFLHMLVGRSVNKIANEYKIALVGSKFATGDAGAATSSYSVDSASPERDFDGMVFNNLLANSQKPGSGYNIKKHVGANGLNQIDDTVDKTLRTLKSGIKSTCGWSEEIEAESADWWAKNRGRL